MCVNLTSPNRKSFFFFFSRILIPHRLHNCGCSRLPPNLFDRRCYLTRAARGAADSVSCPDAGRFLKIHLLPSTERLEAGVSHRPAVLRLVGIRCQPQGHFGTRASCRVLQREGQQPCSMRHPHSKVTSATLRCKLMNSKKKNPINILHECFFLALIWFELACF